MARARQDYFASCQYEDIFDYILFLDQYFVQRYDKVVVGSF